MVNPSQTVSLQCAVDQSILKVSIELAKQSELIAGLLEDGDSNAAGQLIPLPQVKRHVMDKILLFCQHELEQAGEEPLQIEHPLPSTDLYKVVPRWYADYIIVGVDQALLFDLALASNFLNIRPLLKLASARIASQIKGRSTEEVRAFLKMKNDFSVEQETRACEENEFARQFF